jgi:bifunctional diaminopimelate decarboxylase / aspartate kinase
MATRIGAAFLTHEGIDVEWLDARTLLHAAERPGASERSNYLSATCNFEPDTRLQERLAAGRKTVITQGFIASDARTATPCCSAAAAPTPPAVTSRPSCRRAKAGDLDRRAGHVQRSNPKGGAERAPAEVSSHYDEAQEIATSGAKVLHPRCILPVKQYSDPAVRCYATQTPVAGRHGRSAATGGDADAAQVKAICHQEGHHTPLDGDARACGTRSVSSPTPVASVQGAGPVGGPRLDVGDERHRLARPRREHAGRAPRSKRCMTSVASKLCRAEVIGPCAALSVWSDGTSGPSLHRPRRGVRAVRRAAHLPGDARPRTISTSPS